MPNSCEGDSPIFADTKIGTVPQIRPHETGSLGANLPCFACVACVTGVEKGLEACLGKTGDSWGDSRAASAPPGLGIQNEADAPRANAAA